MQLTRINPILCGAIFFGVIKVKVEIEITEEEIKSAIERKVRTAIADQTSNYGVEQYIKESVKSK